jgi:aminoglycoside phosphotransferase (APT) family kinase protein
MSGVIRAGVREVAGLQVLSGGASRQTWSCDAVTGDGRVLPLIVRRNPPSASSESILHEAQALRAAAALGVPVPAVYVATDDPALLGAPAIIMARLAGEALPRRILRDAEFSAARDVLTVQCAEALAAIHRIPVAAVPGIRNAEGPLDRVTATLARTGGAYPALDAALDWLRAHQPLPSTREPVVVHGDFRLGNLLVDSAGLTGVLDWELLHLGDPCEDLAWLCAKPWRFGGPGDVGGFGNHDELIAAYAAAGGIPVKAGVLRWWDVLSTLKWAVMCIEQSELYLTGKEQSLELLALGRRVSESEWDLLNDLDELAPVPPDAADATGPELHGYSSPSVTQILDGVRQFLMTEISEVTTGRPRYLARVAANLLALAAREIDATMSRGAELPDSQARDPGPLTRAQLRRQVSWKLGNDHPGYIA